MAVRRPVLLARMEEAVSERLSWDLVTQLLGELKNYLQPVSSDLCMHVTNPRSPRAPLNKRIILPFILGVTPM